MHEVFISYLSDIAKDEMKSKGVWRPECPVPLERLREVTFSYYDFERVRHNFGKIIVLDAVSTHVAHLFQELYLLKFPLTCAHPLEQYEGDDQASMAANNTSSFNYRKIVGDKNLSLHAYGLAIDINPVQNPFIEFISWKEESTWTEAKIWPKQGQAYLNRTHLRPGMVETQEVVKIFQRHGFSIWGGQWNTPIDWHHFQTSLSLARLLAQAPAEEAPNIFEQAISNPHFLDDINSR